MSQLMDDMDQFENIQIADAKIKVLGVGEIGVAAVNCVVDRSGASIETIAADSDASRLGSSRAALRVLLDKDAPDDASVIEKLSSATEDADLLFVITDSSGEHNIDIASAAVGAQEGALVVSMLAVQRLKDGEDDDDVVDETRPLKRVSDTLIFIPNEDALDSSDCAAHIVNDIFAMLSDPGLETADIGDLKHALRGAFASVVGIGEASGRWCVGEAMRAAISSKLLDRPLKGATRAMVCITSGPDITRDEIDHAGAILANAVDDDVDKVLCGHTVDRSMGDSARVILIASKFDDMKDRRAEMRSQVIGYLDRVGYRHDDSTHDVVKFGVLLDCKISRTDVTMRFGDDGYMTVCRVPLLALAEQRDEVMRYLTMANNQLRVGNFDLDLEDGEIGFRTFTCYDGMVILSDAVISQSFGLGLSVLDDHGDRLMEVMMGYKDADTAFSEYKDSCG